MKSRANFKTHPLHPILIAFPIAFFTGTLVFDLLWLLQGNPNFGVVASYLEISGIFTALVAAIPGAIDYFTIVPPGSSAKKRATSHALINISNIIVFAIAYVLRNEDYSKLAFIVPEFIGMVLLSIAGWMGGTLVYRNQIAVDHRYAGAGRWQEEYLSAKDGKVEVCKSDDLKTDQMKLIHMNGKRIVIGKTEQGYAAFEDSCTHRGGPLSDGVMICGTVQCPWHGSQFDVKTGNLKSGPAKEKINVYPVTEENGKVYLMI
jgi:nitrite reductase/ring-hydroxylating ferredoxin subunit/uncharacterized membrane protein